MHALTDHPIADIFPLMIKAELAELAADIKKNGQRAFIWLYEGKILDGRNRYRACKLAGIEPKTKDYTGNDPLGFVISSNLERKHYSTSQRAIIAARLVTLSHGGNRKQDQETKSALETSVTEAAKVLNVGKSSVKDAKTTSKDPKKTAEVMAGKKSVSKAAREIRDAAKAAEAQRDATGYAIPDELLPLWNRRQEIKDILTIISKARCAVRDVAYVDGEKDEKRKPRNDILYSEINPQSVYINLCNAYTHFQPAMPYAVCPYCNGRSPDRCNCCKGRGLISKHLYDVVVPIELKAVRDKSCVK